jgi:WD40 repeat protein
LLLGSNAGRRSEDLSLPSQEISELSELTVSAIGYNTVSHGGLKSYRRLQTSDDETAKPQPMRNTASSSPDGKLVAPASTDKTVKLWDSATGAARRTLEGHSNWVYAVAFSPDGKLVASASADRTVRLWDSATGSARRTLEGHSNYVIAVAFSPDGKLVASASYDKTVRLWDSATGAAGKYTLAS